jgi:hypothetical protein
MTVPQHMNALAKANEIRLARAPLRRRVAQAGDYATSRDELATVIEADMDLLGSMLVGVLLRWVHKMPPAGVSTLLVYVGSSEYRLLRQLSPAQRGRLVEGLRMDSGELRAAIEARAADLEAAA